MSILTMYSLVKVLGPQRVPKHKKLSEGIIKLKCESYKLCKKLLCILTKYCYVCL